MGNKCFGCENIKDNSFPFEFMRDIESTEYYLDTEGCGDGLNEDASMLRIFYCPVCGKNLKELNNEKS